jgi:hypothetical protein
MAALPASVTIHNTENFNDNTQIQKLKFTSN